MYIAASPSSFIEKNETACITTTPYNKSCSVRVMQHFTISTHRLQWTPLRKMTCRSHKLRKWLPQIATLLELTRALKWTYYLRRLAELSLSRSRDIRPRWGLNIYMHTSCRTVSFLFLSVHHYLTPHSLSPHICWNLIWICRMSVPRNKI